MDIICPYCKTVNPNIKIDDLLKRKKCVNCYRVIG